VSDLSLNTAPPADAFALAAVALRPAVADPTAKLVAPSRPAVTSTPDGAADSSAEPFAALLMGFLQGAQPTVPPVSALPPTELTAAGDDLLLPDAATDMAGLLLMPPAAGPGQQPLTAASAAPASGTALPTSGSNLPPAVPDLVADTTFATPSATTDSSDAVPAARISLADIEHSHQLNLATTAIPVPTDVKAWANRFMPAPDAAAPDLSITSSATDSTADLLPDTESGSSLLQPAGLTAGDLSRLMQNLSQAGGREPFSAAFSTDSNGAGSLFSDTSATAASSKADYSSGLGNMTRGGLSSFPPLQPLGSPQAWTAGLGDRLLTLAGPGTHSARLKLHPENLGTLDIEIKISDSTAQVWFGAQHSQTRDAIEASLPQLREMFAEQGIRLAHAQVDSGTDRRAPDQQQAFNEPDTYCFRISFYGHLPMARVLL
jgi:flagellar hook-length control protein FliK